MTTQTVGGAVARREKEDKLVGWLRNQQEELAMAAASHIKPSTIVRVTQGALRTNDKLMAAAIANPQSLLHCLLDAARLGHEPGTDQYYLVPYGQEVTGIEGYKGIIERMFRAGGVSSVVAQVVRARDAYRSRGENEPPLHTYDEFADPEQRGEMRGAYAYAVFTDGRCSQVIRMGTSEIARHKAKSRGSSSSDSPWQVWPEAMWKKTVLRALEPYVPTSSEWRSAVLRAGADAMPERPAAAPVRLVASEVVPEPQPQDASPAETAKDSHNPPPSRSAGEAHPPALITTGQKNQLDAQRQRLGYDETEQDWEQWLADLAKLASVAAIATPGELTQAEAKGVIDQLKKQADRDALRRLLDDGEAAEGGAGDGQ